MRHVVHAVVGGLAGLKGLGVPSAGPELLAPTHGNAALAEQCA
jgi:hypothetical protein